MTDTLDAAFNPPTTIEIRRDRHGRYLLPHPTTGKEQSWQRVTTFVKLLADTYGLERWRLRKAATGLAARPDLLALIGSVNDPDSRDGKDTITRAVDDAIEAAGASSAANIGTALHALTETIDLGSVLPPCTPEMAARVDQYTATLAAHQLTVDPRFIERVIVNTRFDVAGTADRFLRRPDGSYVIADLKTGSTVQYGQIEFAMQLAAYALADGLYDGAGWAPMPPNLDLQVGYIIHLPADGDSCIIYEVDLIAGAEACVNAVEVRESRTTRPMRALPDPIEQRRRALLERCRRLDPERAAKAKASWPAGVGPVTQPRTVVELDQVEMLLDELDGPRISNAEADKIAGRLAGLPLDLYAELETEAKSAGVPHKSKGWTTWEAATLNGLLAQYESAAEERHRERLVALSDFTEPDLHRICELAEIHRDAIGRRQLSGPAHDVVLALVEMASLFGTFTPDTALIVDHVGGKRALISAAKAAAKHHERTCGNSADAVGADPVIAALAVTHHNTNTTNQKDTTP